MAKGVFFDIVIQYCKKEENYLEPPLTPQVVVRDKGQSRRKQSSCDF